ncbi:MAG TPA: hypothetical protein VEZ12_06665, partial [Herpetosiphonaceae bacterium]|nr:hypothetical protein [Herpetosiphonaceae bacterium]
MVAKHGSPKTGGIAFFLSRRDRVYLLSLMIPFLVYDLILKSLLIFSMPSDPGIVDALDLMQIRLPAAESRGIAEALGLMQSDVLFDVGYILLWTGLLTMARTRVVRRIMVGLLHGLTLCIALLTTVAYQYFKATGSTLDFDTFLRGLSSLDELKGLIASEVSAGMLVLTFALLIYALLGPSLVTSVVDRWYGCLGPHDGAASRRRHRVFRVLVLGLVASACFAWAVLPGVGTTNVSKAFARDAVVHMMLTAVEVAPGEDLRKRGPELVPAERLPSEARLLPTGATRRRNIVLIVLESTRAAATTPYNSMLPSTPFMDELAQSSL